jgi:hypothetical protein
MDKEHFTGVHGRTRRVMKTSGSSVVRGTPVVDDGIEWIALRSFCPKTTYISTVQLFYGKVNRTWNC